MKNLLKLIYLLIFAFIVRPVFAVDIIIDGVLNESIWNKTPKQTTNYQVIPQTLQAVSGNFHYQVISGESGIYLGLIAKVKQPLIIRTQENDSLFNNDHFKITLDMDNTEQSAYVFSVNHQGYYFDGILKQNKELDLDWNSQWQFKTVKSAEIWTAEIFIPWDIMPFSVVDKNQFGLSITRFDEEKNAVYSNIPSNESMNNYLRSFTKLEAVVKSETKLDFFPYISTNRDKIEGNSATNIGAEIFWKPSDNQLVSLTLNPDFGQVESNDLVVNFSALETFFSEKRPFFTENQGIFDVTGPETLRFVHTPRIGSASFYDNSYQGELESALKYTVSAENLKFGGLIAKENSVEGINGRSFLLLRGLYSFGNSNIGLSANRVETPSINRNASTFASDWLYSSSEDTRLNLGVVYSDIEQRDQNTQDLGWWTTISIEQSERHSHELTGFVYGNDLELNDIGFVKRVNRKQIEYEYQYKIPDLDLALIRDIVLEFETEAKTNFQSEELPLVVGAGLELITSNEFEYGIFLESSSAGFDDTLTRQNNSLWLPSAYNAEFELNSREYQWGNFKLAIEAGIEGFSGSYYSSEVSIEQQLANNLHIGFTLSQYSSASWLDWSEGNIIDEFEFTEQGVEFSMDYLLADSHEVRVKFESFIGKANHLNRYQVSLDGPTLNVEEVDDFSFSESAFQLRYKYSLSKLTAFYVSYSFGGEYEDEVAKFGRRNLYRKSIDAKNAHNIFAKLRLHF
jgi:uncharacterized protein DUF5916/cellulose/xylan binding protein with CBM9 domain